MILSNTAQKESSAKQSKLMDKEEALLAFLETPRSRKELVGYMGLSSSVYAIQTYVMPLVERGLVRMTIPEKPSSRNQRFYNACLDKK